MAIVFKKYSSNKNTLIFLIKFACMIFERIKNITIAIINLDSEKTSKKAPFHF
jgi:hypothetical protein